jgi:hypothetical protein
LLRIVGKTSLCAFSNAAALKVVTPACSRKPFPMGKSLRWMCVKQVWRRQGSFSRPRGLQMFDSLKRILMSRLRLLHSNTMRSSASDYFIICDNQRSFWHAPPRRLVFCGFPPSFAPNRKRPSSKATIAVAFSAKLSSTRSPEWTRNLFSRRLAPCPICCGWADLAKYRFWKNR